MSLLETAPPVAEPAGGTLPPRRSRRRRRVVAWSAVALVAALAIVVTIAVNSGPDSTELGPDDPSPTGSKALVQVLRDHGVTVRAADSFAAARRGVADPEETTILVYDADGILSRARLRRLAELAGRVVVVQPYDTALRALAPDVRFRGAGSGTAGGCTVGGLVRSDRVTANGERYTVVAGTPATECLGDATHGYGLVRLRADSGAEIDVVGNAAAFRNENALAHANGAYALGLLGRSADLVWYLPGDADVPAGAGDVSLSPGWYSAAVTLALLVGLAAILWRGRRFGALAVENLPVVVPASETMEGRARLYARSSARLRALDALRIGAIERMARDCGLPRVASLPEVVDAVATVTGRPRDAVAATLVDAEPARDAELMRLATDLADLERRVHAETRGR